jgi:hypothetical protein
MQQYGPLATLIFDEKTSLNHHLLGLNPFINRRQDNKVILGFK